VPDQVPRGRRSSLSARLKTGAMVAVAVNGFVNETSRNDGDGVERSVMTWTAQLVLTCTSETGESTQNDLHISS
jgi:hypothetical protein